MGRLMGLSSQSAMALLPPSSPLLPFHRTSDEPDSDPKRGEREEKEGERPTGV